MHAYLLTLLLLVQIYTVRNSTTALTKRSLPELKLTITNHSTPPATIIPKTPRQPKSPNLPIAIHLQPQLLVQNLHVIPIHSNLHNNVHIISHNGTTMGHQTQLYPILIPIHNYVPVHDLAVIPLQRVSKHSQVILHMENNEEDRYRHPFGGYGVGWRFGGHGAGHGYHYSYG